MESIYLILNLHHGMKTKQCNEIQYSQTFQATPLPKDLPVSLISPSKVWEDEFPSKRWDTLLQSVAITTQLPFEAVCFRRKKSGRIRTSVWRSQCWQSHLCWLLVPYITISFNRACVSRQICFFLVLVDMVADLAYMTFMNQYIAVGIRAFYSRQVGAAHLTHLTHLTHLPLFKWVPPT